MSTCKQIQFPKSNGALIEEQSIKYIEQKLGEDFLILDQWAHSGRFERCRTRLNKSDCLVPPPPLFSSSDEDTVEGKKIMVPEKQKEHQHKKI